MHRRRALGRDAQQQSGSSVAMPPDRGHTRSTIQLPSASTPLAATAGRSDNAEEDQQIHLQHNGIILPHHLLPSPPRPAGERKKKKIRAETPASEEHRDRKPLEPQVRRYKRPLAAATRQIIAALTSAPPEATPREGESRTLFNLSGARTFHSPPPGTNATLSTSQETRNEIPTSSRRRSSRRRQRSGPAPARRGGETLGSLFRLSQL